MSEAPHIVRTAAQPDWEAICELNPGLRGGGHGPDRMRLSLERGWLLLAELDKRVVGYVAYDYNFFDRGFVEHLIVHPEFRRRGLGEALMRAAGEACDTPDLFTSTNESNKPMQALLAKLGYERCGTVDQLDAGDPEWFYALHKGA